MWATGDVDFFDRDLVYLKDVYGTKLAPLHSPVKWT